MKILDAKESRPLEGGPTYSLRNRAFRASWMIVWFALGYWTPPMLHRWRRVLLRLFGAKVSNTALIYGPIKVWYPPHLEVGHYATIGPRVNIYNVARITLDEYAVVSQGVNLCSAGHDIDDLHFQTVARPITIGRRAWVAAEAFVGPGVRVGEGAVLGARGCAFRDLSPWTVHGGNPARLLKHRSLRLDETISRAAE